ncbi:hypothetical protein, partial [Actinocorallia lasiicapitis]
MDTHRSEKGIAVSVVVTGAGRRAVARTVRSVRQQTLRSVEAVVPPRHPSGSHVLFVAAGELLDRHACLTLFAAAVRTGAD